MQKTGCIRLGAQCAPIQASQEVLDTLKKAIECGPGKLECIKQDLDLLLLRDEPEFRKLVNRTHAVYAGLDPGLIAKFKPDMLLFADSFSRENLGSQKSVGAAKVGYSGNRIALERDDVVRRIPRRGVLACTECEFGSF